jgi:hypothetical protein
VLEEHEPVMGWLHRFQYAYSAVMADRLDAATPLPARRAYLVAAVRGCRERLTA